MNRKHVKLSIIIFALLLVGLVGVSFSFFNYTRTGALNNLGTGRIYFNSVQNGSLNMTNVFPMTSSEANAANLDSITVSITGDTTYHDGEEYLISLVDVNNTIGNKRIPVSYIATYEATTGNTIGEASNTYWESREAKNSTIYLLNTTGQVTEDRKVLVGFIKNDNTGINGTLTIKAYIDADRMVISDTYDGTESDNMGTTNELVNGREVFTTSEWNSLGSTPISFKIRAESNEGIWVSPSMTLANKVKGRLGQDGVVAVNSNGDLYTGEGTIREYRYSGIGNYCTYTDGTNNYNISVEGTECPEVAYTGSDPYIAIGSSDEFRLWGTGGQTPLTRVTTTAIDSGLKNYVMFNDERWRIIGVFGDNVKIMKDLPLMGNITDNPVDTVGLNDTDPNSNQLYTNNLNEQFLIKRINMSAKYGYFYYNYPTNDNIYNSNDWTHSGLMYYLNEAKAGSYYNTINSNYKRIIDTTTYYLGNVSSLWDSGKNLIFADGTAKEIYEQERGNVECGANIVSLSQNNNCNIWNGNSATWTGKIGLMYISDYAYAASTDKWSTNAGAYYYNGGSLNNWMFNNDSTGIDTISPSSYNPERVMVTCSIGHVEGDVVNFYSAQRPALYLVPSVETIGGDGSYNNPYILDV